MKVKQLLQQVNKDTFIQDYLTACGVHDVEEYFYPTGIHIDKPTNYENMDKGIGMIEEVVPKQSADIYIIQDCDVDGICSAALMYKFLIFLGVHINRIKVLFHDGKKHGLSKEIMTQIKNALSAGNSITNPLIIIPDAGTNDVEQCKSLVNLGCEILILDHHDKEIDNPYATIINNQTSPNVQNKNLCGTGVVWKFITAYCKKNIKNSQLFYMSVIDIVNFANLADVMDMRSYENRTISKWANSLLDRLNHPFFEYLRKKYIKDGKVTPEAFVWNIVPKLNAVCRLGADDKSMELKTKVFDAFASDLFIRDIVIGEQSFFNEVIKDINAAYRKQKEITKELYESIVSEREPSENKVEIITIGSTPYTGRVVSKLMDYYNKPVLLVHEDNNVLSGSLRSPYPLKDTLNASNLMLVCQGHEQACGVAWNKDDTEALIEYCNELDMPEPTIEVCCSYEPHKIPHNIFGMFDEWDYLYAKGVPYPLFYIAPIRISSKDIKLLGANKTTIKFTYQGIDYVKFFASQKDKEQLFVDVLNSRREVPIELEVIGKLQLNEWNGNKSEQVLIDRFVCKEYKPNLKDLW